jgi:hypothetical protein
MDKNKSPLEIMLESARQAEAEVLAQRREPAEQPKPKRRPDYLPPYLRIVK